MGRAKTAEAAMAAAIMKGVGDTPNCVAALQAMGATRMAVAELEMKVESREVTT